MNGERNKLLEPHGAVCMCRPPCPFEHRNARGLLADCPLVCDWVPIVVFNQLLRLLASHFLPNDVCKKSSPLKEVKKSSPPKEEIFTFHSFVQENFVAHLYIPFIGVHVFLCLAQPYCGRRLGCGDTSNLTENARQSASSRAGGDSPLVLRIGLIQRDVVREGGLGPSQR